MHRQQQRFYAASTRQSDRHKTTYPAELLKQTDDG
jgi:hypothetical protein